ncbi:uncharacterized protein EV154DRAFT_495344 [Mucor mucedo]|uniref:uncharacterized protein n=1 Tax=Mucor mucedo TaxID=29922 RepID=UPI00221EC54F|nr:uncharacterized protein EV154DRAFT_495344 [Mucor mucedo]KAI7895571.1 hypothetical protein EV154DRAFT_495344 [Mucor mucedo]
MLASLLNFHIRFSGNAIDISDFINESCRQEIHAFVHGKSYVNEDTITICKTKLILKTMVKYEFHPDYSTARHILSRLGPYVQQFELVYLEKEIIQDILEALFSTQHRNINALVFHGLKFKKFTKANLFYTSYIPSITFHDCKFSRQSLQVLSTRFTKLDTVHFKGCRFDKYFDYPWVNIIMPLTDIHTLCISYHVPFSATARENMNELRWHNDGYEMIENPRTFPLVSITLTEEGITRYYYTRDEENPVVVETSETQFHLLAKMVPTRAFFKVIKISVKSIQILSLKLSSDRSKDIQMIF